MKSYSSKANARRAVKHQLGKDAVEGQDYALIELDEKDGLFSFRLLSADGVDTMQINDKGASAERENVVENVTDIKNGRSRTESTVDSPVQRVWAIADSLPGARRKAVIAACVEQGIAFFTARTQYQKWAQARRASAAETPHGMPASDQN